MSDNPFQSNRLVGRLLGGLLTAVVLIVSVVAARFLLTTMAKRPATAVAESASAPSAPARNGGANVLTLPISAARPDGRRVFICETNGVTVYADAPCDDRANSVFLDTTKTNVYDSAAATPSEAIVAPSPRPSAQQESPLTVGREPAAPATKAMECAQIQNAIDQVDALARLGHSSAEGDRLRAERKSLSDQRYAARCGR